MKTETPQISGVDLEKLAVIPLMDRVVVEFDEIPEEYTTPSGLVIPDYQSRMKLSAQTGIVVAVGQGYRNADGSYSPLTVKKGDRVAFNPSGCFETTVATKQGPKYFRYIAERDIIAIIP